MKQSFPRHTLALLLALTVLFLGVWQAPFSRVTIHPDTYLPLHIFMESFSVVVAAMIFGIGWHAESSSLSRHCLVLACAFLGVALLDMAHFMSYAGMPAFITPSNPSKAIYFWLTARLLAAASLLTAAVLVWRPFAQRPMRYFVLAGVLGYTALTYWLVLYHEAALPTVFVTGQGLTTLKIGIEYFCMGLLAIAAILYWKKVDRCDGYDCASLFMAASVSVLSALCFTLYSAVTDVFNLLGHLYKVVAYFYLFRALFISSVREPFQRLYQSQAALFEEKERAQVTLHSIGDAVITTDLELRLQSLNPVAEQLTGWREEEARGEPLDKIFRIYNEETRQQADNPARRAIAEGTTIKLGGNIVLLARDGTELAIEDSAAPIRGRDGSILGCIVVFHDVSERRSLQGKIAWQAGHDILTGLPNRALLADRLQQAIAHAQRNNLLLAIGFIDLDGFKPINDQYGHDIGDLLLKEVANRLNQAVRANDTVARLGGDEFVVLLTDMSDMDEVEPGLKRILEVISAPYLLDDNTCLTLSASMGVTVYPFDSADPDTLLRHADQAMYQAKQSGHNIFNLFDAEQDRVSQLQREKIDQIQLALKNREFQLYYQPKVNMRSGKVVGAEALIRWIHPQHGMIPPLEFLPLIEQTSLIVEVGNWVLHEALRQMSAWLEEGLVMPVSINVAARELQSQDFVDRLKAALRGHPGIKPGWLELELLESAALMDIQQVKRVISACRNLGVNFALDDFGTGYSSLAYLKQLPADTLKIDQSFVRDILHDPDDLALVEGVVSLTRVFNRAAITEGVETAEHGALLMRLGCDLAQGYGIARPMPAQEIPAWVARFKPDAQWALWADCKWDLDDFPLIVAQLDHQRWVHDVLSTLDGKASTLTHAELVDPTLCRFGRWYQTRGLKRYGHLAEMRAIDPLHQRVHQLGAEIIQLHQRGKTGDARERCVPLLTLRDEIVERLIGLQRAVVKSNGAETEYPYRDNLTM